MVNHCKDPYQTTRIEWNTRSLFLRGSIFSPIVNLVNLKKHPDQKSIKVSETAHVFFWWYPKNPISPSKVAVLRTPKHPCYTDSNHDSQGRMKHLNEMKLDKHLSHWKLPNIPWTFDGSKMKFLLTGPCSRDIRLFPGVLDTFIGLGERPSTKVTKTDSNSCFLAPKAKSWIDILCHVWLLKSWVQEQINWVTCDTLQK